MTKIAHQNHLNDLIACALGEAVGDFTFFVAAINHTSLLMLLLDNYF
jgi:hypothetical protein